MCEGFYFNSGMKMHRGISWYGWAFCVQSDGNCQFCFTRPIISLVKQHVMSVDKQEDILTFILAVTHTKLNILYFST